MYRVDGLIYILPLGMAIKKSICVSLSPSLSLRACVCVCVWVNPLRPCLRKVYRFECCWNVKYQVSQANCTSIQTHRRMHHYSLSVCVCDCVFLFHSHIHAKLFNPMWRIVNNLTIFYFTSNNGSNLGLISSYNIFKLGVIYSKVGLSH